MDTLDSVIDSLAADRAALRQEILEKMDERMEAALLSAFRTACEPGQTLEELHEVIAHKLYDPLTIAKVSGMMNILEYFSGIRKAIDEVFAQDGKTVGAGTLRQLFAEMPDDKIFTAKQLATMFGELCPLMTPEQEQQLKKAIEDLFTSKE